ncbi:MAG TPA: YHS domain-containing protein, partial [Thermoanaerobaculia bacterium]|nr:YHS domain-containing protein [Thermoanaerobaculia bacterium]
MATDPVAIDPVCGMTVKPSSAAAKRVYEGKTYSFCAKGCAEAFERDPKRYLQGGPKAMPGPTKVAPSSSFAKASGDKPLPSPALRSPKSEGGGKGGKQTALFEIKSPASAFLRKPPVMTPAPPGALTAPPTPALSRVALSIEGMHCASCVATIEGALSAVVGVSEAAVNLATGRADVTGRGLNTRRLIEAVRSSGYAANPAEEEEPGTAEDRTSREMRQVLRRTLFAAALTLPVLAVSMADIHFPGRDLALLLLTLPVYLYSGWPFLS